MNNVLIFDIPFGHETEKRQINRMLRKADATMLQQSVWKHKDLKTLIKIGIKIRNLGGKAEILEERFLF